MSKCYVCLRCARSARSKPVYRNLSSNAQAAQVSPKVFVLQRNEPKRPRSVARLEPQPLPAARLDLLTNELLKYQPASHGEVPINEIDEMKPRRLRVSLDRFRQLSGQLDQGFRKPQLQAYCGGKGLKGYRSLKKEEVLDRILREIWHVEVAEEIRMEEDVTVTKAIPVTNRDLFFLLGGDGRILRQWAESCDARITVDPADRVLHVQCTAVNLRRLERQINHLLEKVITREVDIRAFTSAMIRENVLNDLSVLAGVFVEHQSNHSVKIHCLGPKTDRIEDAQKFLLGASPWKSRASVHLLWPNTQSSKNFLPRAVESSLLPWYLRDMPWARWRAAVARGGNPRGPSDVEVALEEIFKKDTRGMESIQELAFKTINHGSHYDYDYSDLFEVRGLLDSPPEGLEMGGANSIRNRNACIVPESADILYKTKFGHILHDSTSLSNSSAISVDALKEADSCTPITFCPTIPYLSNWVEELRPFEATLGGEETNVADPYRYFFRLHLSPSPWSQKEFWRYPVLQLDIDLDEQGKTSNPRLSAIHSEIQANVMLPRESSDLQFQRIVSTQVNTDQPGLTQFLQASTLDPSKHSRLRTPFEMTLNANGIDTTYVSTSLRYHREIDYKWHGFRLTRSNIEGGEAGGRITQVTLHCPSSNGFPNDIDWRIFVSQSAAVVNAVGKQK